LVGLNSRKSEALAWQQTKYYVSVMVKNCSDKFVWRFISVPGACPRNGSSAGEVSTAAVARLVGDASAVRVWRRKVPVPLPAGAKPCNSHPA
jgi:hypothetical protein